MTRFDYRRTRVSFA